MGIRGLLGYLRRTYGQGFQTEVISNTKLVVDAQNVVFSLLHRYNNRQRSTVYGSNYDDVANCVRKCVQKLKRNGLEPIFIFDGLSTRDEDTWNTVRNRNQVKLDKFINSNDIQFSMLLAIPVILSILREENVAIVQADDSADSVIAALANELNCPILSGDADFLLQNISAGVAFITDNELDSLIDNAIPVIKVQMWSSEYFTRKNGIDSDQLVIFLSVLQYLYAEDRKNFPAIVDHIKRCNGTTEEKIQTAFQIFQENQPNLDLVKFKKIVNGYLDIAQICEYVFSESCRLLSFRGNAFPEEYQRRWRDRKFPPYLVNVLCTRKVNLPFLPDDVSQASAYDAGREIRQTAYGIMLAFEQEHEKFPVEYTRVDTRFQDVPIRVLVEVSRFGPVPNLAKIPTMDQSLLKRLLISLLGVDFEKIKEFPDDIQLFIGILAFWHRHGAVAQHHVQAAILCMIRLRTLEPFMAGINDEFLKSLNLSNSYVQSVKNAIEPIEKSRVEIPNYRAFQHPFAQYQTIFLDVIQINQLLLTPFPDLKPQYYFRGNFLVHAAKLLQNGKFDAEKLLRNPSGNELYYLLRRIETRL